VPQPSPKSVLPPNQQLRVSAGSQQLRFRLSTDGSLYVDDNRLLYPAVEFRRRDTRVWNIATCLRHTDVRRRLNAADSYRDPNRSGARRLSFSEPAERNLAGSGWHLRKSTTCVTS